jgi:hypothetical protein
MYKPATVHGQIGPRPMEIRVKMSHGRSEGFKSPNVPGPNG